MLNEKVFEARYAGRDENGNINETFEQAVELDATCDSMLEAKRTCGTCGEEKPLCEFYKDGKDREGNQRYRRDCKDCYRVTRLRARNMKRRRR